MSPSRTGAMDEVIRGQKAGRAIGLYSVCSAHPVVLEAAMMQGISDRWGADRSRVCVESTSNQVNQEGGYSGMTPARFARYVRGIAEKAGLPAEGVILGGDHLGPHAWRKEP